MKMEKMLEPMHSKYPMFHVTAEQMPEIKKWEVGKVYSLRVKVKQVSYNEFEGQPPRAEFEIMEYQTGNEKALDYH